MKSQAAFYVAITLAAAACEHQQPFRGPLEETETWLSKYGKQIDQPFSGPLAFSHAEYARCLEDESAAFDIAILGMPFDTGSRRQRASRGYTLAWGNNPYELGLKILDCGDVPTIPFDNALAVDQMEVAYATLLARPLASKTSIWPQGALLAKDGREHPRVVSLGGDHTIVLPILRALNRVYGPVSVIHFDAHLDTWNGYPGAVTDQSRVTHGTFFHIANEEGLIANSSVHAGIRCKLQGIGDIENDESVGFHFITSDDIDDHGVTSIVERIRKRVGDTPVYLSEFSSCRTQSKVLNGIVAGTPEAGGWTSREVKRIIRGLAGLNFVGADVVEVAPAYDHAEITATAAADIVHDFLSMFMSFEPPKPANLPGPWPRDEL
ncbi:arginase family-domain-containing protein [Lanmaoa asiatica]|nr:arginase family-domain-containing protein [Lanmaoa asiatica]